MVGEATKGCRSGSGLGEVANSETLHGTTRSNSLTRLDGISG